MIAKGLFGQSQDLVNLFFIKQMARRQGCAEPQGASGKQDVLHGGVNRGPRGDSASRIAVKTAYNEHRRFVEMLGEVVPCCQHALLLRLSFAGEEPALHESVL